MKVSTKIVSRLLPTTGCLHLVLVVTAVVLAKHSILTSFVISISPVIEPDLCKRKRKREGRRKRKKLPTCWKQKLSSLLPSGSSDHGSREVRSTEMKKRRCVFVLKKLNSTILAYFSYVRGK